MAKVITMHRLSDTMTDGTVAVWHKKIGDTVSEGDILADIETDKATMEFESFHSGTLLHIGVQEGETAPVDSVLAIIGEKGEDISDLLKSGNTTPKQEEAPEKTEESKAEELASSSDFTMPQGVKVVTMPRLSDTMTDGTVAVWHKKIGDTVNEGDILADIETDKATMEFESFNSGTLLYIGVQEGESAPVDSILAIIGKEGTDISGVVANFGKEKTDSAPKKEETTKQEATQTPAQTSTNTGNRIFASPLAKRIAQEKGIDLTKVKGTGENGRITKADVENFTPSAAATTSSQPTAEAGQPQTAQKLVAGIGETLSEEVKNSQMRKVIAKRLSESKFTAPHYYLTIEVDMDNAMASRGVINSLPDTKVSFNDMVIKAVA